MWSRRRSLPSINIVPAWFLAVGNPDATENVGWRDEQITIFGTQPTKSPNQRFIVVGDVWLSNRSQLLKLLCGQLPTTDIELVACLWDLQGVQCLNLLEGMLALCVWDRELKELRLVRDRIGAKTLYYTTAGSTRYVAPCLRTLAPYHSNELDLVALRDYLCCAFVPGEQTLWRQVRELRPGNCLKLPNETVEVYWQVQEQITNPNQSLEWHGKHLRFLLEQIVQEYLPQNEPAGVFLSGGIDSSCITALVAKLHDRPIHTYSIHFGAECQSELEFSNLVAEQYQTQHHILEISPDKMWEHLPETMAYLDDPIGEALTVPNLLLGRLAKESVDVVLNGEGGDPCFAGPKNKPMLLNSLYGEVTQQDNDELAAYLNSYKKCYLDLPKLLKPDVWASVQSEPSVFSPLLNAEVTYLNRLMLLNIKFKGDAHILTKVNNLTSAAGIQGRSPLSDRRIVELSMQTPPEYKLSGAVEKAVLKQAVADLLPDAIVHRPKSGMMVPVQLWFRTIWYQKARALLLNKKAAIAPYLDQSLIRDWLDYRGDAWNRYGVKLWLLVSLEFWLQVQKSK